jgi:hypothetical protein
VLITVAAGAGLTVVVAVDLDVQRLLQDHLFRWSVQLIAMMNAGLATRDLAVPTPPVASPVVGFERPQLPTVARWASTT